MIAYNGIIYKQKEGKYMKKYYPGNIVEGKVVGIKPYGVFVSLDEEVMGLLHISEISDEFVSNIYKIVKLGDVIQTKILDIDYVEKKAKLSIKAIKKQRRHRRKKHSFAEEKIQINREFFSISVRMEDFIKDAKERLRIND